MADPIKVTVTSLSESVTVNGSSSGSVTIANGGGVNVAVGTVAVGDSLVTSGTVQVGKVVTLAPGAPATVANSGTGIAAVLDFGIPAGAAGSTPAFAIGTVSTLAAGSAATVTATTKNSGADVTLDFGIPRGDPGEGSSGGASLSDGTPAGLGTAAAGTSSLASRADHVHPVPTISYASLSGIPSTFAPAAHQHAISDVSGLLAALDARLTDAVTKLNNLTGSLTLAAGSNVTITPSGSTLTIAASAEASLSDDPAQPLLPFPASGTSTDAARSDHVHPFPTPVEIGALDNDSVVDGGDYTGYISANTITITTQPTNQAASGGAATFSVVATVEPGGTLSYQWQRGVSSTAGATWTQRTIPNIGTGAAAWESVTYGGGLFVAVAFQSNASRVSSDGTSWTNYGAMTAFAQWQAVTYGNGLFVAFANDTDEAATSTDGITWHARAVPFGAWRSVAYGGGMFVAVANNSSTAATSTDGITWTQRTLPVVSGWTSVIYGGGVFVAFGGGSTYATSADGVAWTARTMPGGFAGTRGAYGGGLFALLSNGGQSATSPDGITWTIGMAPIAQWNGVTYGDGVFVAVGQPFGGGNGSLAAYSTDGIAWTPSTLPVAAQWKSVAFGGGTFVAVSWSTAAATSAAQSGWSSLTGETSDQVSLSGLTAADDGSQYRVVVSATNAASVTSNAATLTVP